MKGWLKRKDAAEYAGVGIRTFDAWLRDGLFSVKPRKGPILIKTAWIDEYLEQFEVKNGNTRVDEIVNETLKEFGT